MNLEAQLRTEAALLQQAFNLTADEARRRVLDTHRLYDPAMCVEIPGNSFIPETRFKTELELRHEIGRLQHELRHTFILRIIRQLEIGNQLRLLKNAANLLGYTV